MATHVTTTQNPITWMRKCQYHKIGKSSFSLCRKLKTQSSQSTNNSKENH